MVCRVNENPESLPKLDWAHYKKNVAPAMVDKFQKEYEALKIEYPVDKYTSQLDALEKEAVSRCFELIILYNFLNISLKSTSNFD